MKDIEAALALGEKATGGEWTHPGGAMRTGHVIDFGPQPHAPYAICYSDDFRSRHNAAFIAAMCSNRGEMVRKLLERCEEAEKDAERYEYASLNLSLCELHSDGSYTVWYEDAIDSAIAASKEKKG